MSTFECAALKVSIRAVAYQKPIILASIFCFILYFQNLICIFPGSGSSICLWHEAQEFKFIKKFTLDSLNQSIIGIKFVDYCFADHHLPLCTEHDPVTEQNIIIYSTHFILYCQLFVIYEAGNIIHCELRQKFKANLRYWIIDCVFGNNFAYVLNSRNEVIIYDLNQRKIFTQIYGPQKCILYSGKLLQYSCDGMVVASGTVFRSILLWAIDGCKSSPNLVNIQALHGHDGVIFSVDHNWQYNMLISASDDRSIRLWAGNQSVKGNSNLFDIEFWKGNSFQLVHVYYGHQSRIWQCSSLEQRPIVISAGEDSSIFAWSLIPPYVNIAKRLLFRNNRIWCFKALQHCIAFGGSDGAVKFLNISDFLSINDYCSNQDNITIAIPKAIRYLQLSPGIMKLFSASVNGIFQLILDKDVLHNLELNASAPLDELQKMENIFNDYISLDTNNTRTKVVLASKFGHLCLLVTSTNGHLHLVQNVKPFDSKIFNVSFVDDKQFITCLANGKIFLFSIDDDRMVQKKSSHFVLPVTRHPWSSCGLLVDDSFLIVGSYSGSVFSFYTNGPDAIDQFRNIHGQNGVTCLQKRPQSRFVYSSGRNGKIIEYLLTKNKQTNLELHLLRTFVIFPEMDWIGGFRFESHSPFALKYAFGFESRKFLLWDLFENRVIFEHDCGGGHRSWDLFIDNSQSKQINLHFSYTKKNKLENVHRPLPLNTASLVHTYSSLPRKINCCAQLYNSPKVLYFLLAGEDNMIQVIQYHKPNKTLLLYTTLHCHISNVSSIKCLSSEVQKDSDDPSDIYAISVGGRAQLVVWKFTVTSNKELICQERISNFLGLFDQHLVFEERIRKANKRAFINDVDIRYLDVDFCQSPNNLDEFVILVGCSDSGFRLYRYNDKQRQIVHSRKVSSIETACFLVAKLFNIDCPFAPHQPTIQSKNTICALGSTDGYLCLWPLSLNGKEDLQVSNEPILSYKLHLAGINAIEFCVVNGKLIDSYFKHKSNHLNILDTLLALTGGDDNALKLTIMSISKGENALLKLTVLHIVEELSMHSCQITGLSMFC